MLHLAPFSLIYTAQCLSSCPKKVWKGWKKKILTGKRSNHYIQPRPEPLGGGGSLQPAKKRKKN